MSAQTEKFKTEVTVEFPAELEGNLFILTWDPQLITGFEESEMKEELASAVHNVLANYPSAEIKAYKFKK